MVEEPVEDSGRSAEGIETRLSGHGERSLPQLALLGRVPYYFVGLQFLTPL
jgi:hypothetical protein